MKISKKILSIIISILVLIEPFLDCFTYLQIRYNLQVISIASVIRTLIFMGMVIYLIEDRKSKPILVGLLIYFLIYISVQGLVLKSGMVTSFNTLLTIFYLPVLVYFLNTIKIDKKYFNLRVIMITYLVFLSFIVIPYLFRYGNYANNFYEGKNGFYGLFYGGNEISNILIIMLPLVIEYLVKNKNYLLIFITFIGLIMSIYLVGTKTIVLGSIIVSIYFLYKYLYPGYKSLDYKKKRLIGSLLVIFILGSILVIPKMNVTKNIIRAIEYYGFNMSNIFSINGLDKLVFSGRLDILSKVCKLYINSPLSMIFLGLNKTYVNIFKGIEIDLFDIFFSLGLIGFIIYLYIFYMGIKKKRLKGTCLFTFILSILISLVTGHILNTPSVSIFVGLLFLLDD